MALQSGQGVRQAARSSGVSAAKASRIKAEMVAAEQLTYALVARRDVSVYRPQASACGLRVRLGDRQRPGLRSATKAWGVPTRYDARLHYSSRFGTLC